MKLVKYLANHIKQEKFAFVLADIIRGDIEIEIDADELQKIIGEGIEAFESTEAVKVLVVSEEISEPIKQAIQNAEDSK